MLGTRERTLLLESLRPPAGYRLRRAVGTSYTLDLIALLTAPLAFTFFDAHDENGAPVTDPVALLEALRRHAENVTLFCQAGAIAVPKPEQTLLAYLEGSVVEVQPPRAEGIFHPKLWVLAFEANEAPAIYRVLCLSRNLTFARSWDTCLSLEGPLMQRQRGYGRNKPLAELLLALPALTTRPIRSELRADLERMAYEVRRVDFRPPPPFTDFRMHHFGLWRRRGWAFPSASRSLVISPYLVGSVVKKLVGEHGLDVLVSRPEAFEEVIRRSGREALPKTCYVLSQGAELDAREAQEENAQEPNAPPPPDDQIDLAGLHAKLFLFENGREARLFTGSANATAAAFGLNVEVLVELFGTRKDCGITSLLGSEDHPRLETLRSLLQEYTPPPGPITCDDPSKDLMWKAERLARVLGASRLTATVRELNAGQQWDITLSGELPVIPSDAVLTVWPATLSPEAAQRIGDRPRQEGKSDGAIQPIAIFKGMSFEALTGFFAFEVSLRKGPHAARQRFAMTAELVGAPENRKERLLRSFLKDRRRVLRLLLLILMGEGADVSAFVQAAHHDETRSEGSFFGGWQDTALLEALLWSLSRNPDRIDEAARLIADLGSTPEGKELLPEGLNEIWEPVCAARAALE